MVVVRRSGYDGASLAELSRATGLGKSSLYHHFPDGKDDMIRAVLEHLVVDLRERVFTPLRAPGPARRRVERMVRTLDDYYRGGREACVLGNLVLGTSRTRFRRQLKLIFDEWMTAIADTLLEANLPRAVARARAEDAIVRIEGGLVLAGAMDDASIFTRTLKQLPPELLAPVGART